MVKYEFVSWENKGPESQTIYLTERALQDKNPLTNVPLQIYIADPRPVRFRIKLERMVRHTYNADSHVLMF
jgi:hypothetical protein